MLRGGSWINNNPENLRCSYRNNNTPDNRNNNIGFRVVMVSVGAEGIQRCWRGAARGKALRRRSQEGSPNLAQRAPRRGKDAAQAVAGRRRCRKSRPAFALYLLKPPADHAPNFVQALRNEEQLLLADPAPVADEPPKDAQLLQVQIHAEGVNRGASG